MNIVAGKQFAGIVLLLIVAALLEVGGDAGIRKGLEGQRAGLLIGALLLIVYGVVVNLTKLDFGRLMGLYIAIFFVVSQLLAVLLFKEKVQLPLLVGGALIVAGGCVLYFWRTT